MNSYALYFHNQTNFRINKAKGVRDTREVIAESHELCHAARNHRTVAKLLREQAQEERDLEGKTARYLTSSAKSV